MQEISPPKKVRVAESKIENAGRGVFAVENIAEIEIIEVCPVLETSLDDYENLKATKLRNYYFIWGDEPKRAVLCLGYGSLYFI